MAGLLLLFLGGIITNLVDCSEFMSLHGPTRETLGIHLHYRNPMEALKMSLSELRPVFLHAPPQKYFPTKHSPQPTVRTFKLPQTLKVVPNPKVSSSNMMPVYVENRPSVSKPHVIHKLTPKRPKSLQLKIGPHPKQSIRQLGDNLQQQQMRHISLPSIRVENQQEAALNQNKHFSMQNSNIHENNRVTLPQKSQSDNNNFIFVSQLRSPLFGQPKEFVPHDTITNQNVQQNPPHVTVDFQPKKENIPQNIHQILHSNGNNIASPIRGVKIENNSNFFAEPIGPVYNERQHLHQHEQEGNEKLNLFKHGRSMQRENRPQLPPRPSFDSGTIHIHAPREHIPVLHLDGMTDDASENPTIFLQNDKHTGPSDQRKTFLVFKAPALITTVRPSSAPFSVGNVENINQNIRRPEFTSSTPPVPTVMANTLQAPAIMLDLVQIPDETLYEKPHEYKSSSNVNHQAVASKSHNGLNLDSYSPELFTTPLYKYDEHNSASFREAKNYYPKATEKLYSDFHATNISSLPVSYSSSVVIRAPTQSTKPTKRSKMTLKKATPLKKKNKSIKDETYGSQNVPGRPGADYPTYHEIPFTNFNCREKKTPGFYADLEASCQVFHNCDMEMTKHSFLCPNGTIFHQELFICDWWYNVNCDDSPEYFSLNDGLYIDDKQDLNTDKV